MRAPEDGTDQDLGVRDERRGEKAVMRLERESAECSSRGQSAILHISTCICQQVRPNSCLTSAHTFAIFVTPTDSLEVS